MAKQRSPKPWLGVRVPPGLPISHQFKVTMSTNAPISDKPESVKSDSTKWLIALALLAVGLIAFYSFAGHSLLVRVVFLLGMVGASVFFALQTEKGRDTVNFLREAQIEVRKVVWPSRQETLQTTAIVALMVILVALFIWMLDSLLFWLVRLLTGQGS